MSGNYRSLVIAGCGTVGSAVLKLGTETLRSFDRVAVADKSPEALVQNAADGFAKYEGDITDPSFLTMLIQDIPPPALFVNLCPGIDNVRVRKECGCLDIAYIDSAAPTPSHMPDEFRYSVLMPYAYTPFPTPRPQLVCFGINPGLVELVARRLLRAGRNGPCEILVAEHDTLRAASHTAGVPVGWSPRTLIEETMLSPSLWVDGGLPAEKETPGAQKIQVRWAERALPARLVAHEDIWNMHLLPDVGWAGFSYTLSDEVMRVLDGTVEAAMNTLCVPPADTPLTGTDTVLVSVRCASSQETRALAWTADHRLLWETLRINGVAYQTAKGILLGIELLQRTRYGALPGLFSATTLPIRDDDWSVIESVEESLGIRWLDAAQLGVSLLTKGEHSSAGGA